MQKLLLLEAPLDTMSGYGKHSRDIALSLLKAYPDWDIRIAPLQWGNTRIGVLDPNNAKDKMLLDRFIKDKNLPRQPEIHIQITVPNEFRPLGKFSIGITAGIETTNVSAEWIAGMNRMNLCIVPSEFAKQGFLTSVWRKQHPNGQVDELKCNVPIEVLFEGVDTDIFKMVSSFKDKMDNRLVKQLNTIKEDFCFLFVGHWLKGDHTHDRKDVGGLIETFFRTFRNQEKQPALILKTSGATQSVMDRTEILQKIEFIRNLFDKKDKLPEIYFLHTELTDEEVNLLYNHPKVKAFVSFTHGEGYGRPFVEFAAATHKPILAPNFSGHVDFLRPEAIMIEGELKQINPSAVWDNVLIPESKWFYVSYPIAEVKLQAVFNNYGLYEQKSRMLHSKINKNWSLEKMTEGLKDILDKYCANITVTAPLNMPAINLPKLMPVDEAKPKLNLPNLKLPRNDEHN